MGRLITEDVLTRRAFWVEEIRKLSGDFGDDSSRLEKELQAELKKFGNSSLIDHFRLCGNIPESYGHDSSEEKLYSKYTDSLLCEAFKCLGLRGLVIKERGDAADVEAFAGGYSLVADAKAFRLSRTAKNQKDFKVQAMHGWKRGKDFAMVVCPIHQLQQRSSQLTQRLRLHVLASVCARQLCDSRRSQARREAPPHSVQDYCEYESLKGCGRLLDHAQQSDA